MRILVIDDDPNINDSLKWLLEDNGHEVRTCSSAEQGLARAEKESYELAFLDVMLPGMGGLDALKKLLGHQPALQVIMISGHADVSVAVKATKLGAYDFFEKPLNPEKVLLEVKKLSEQLRVRAQVSELKRLVELEYQMIGDSPAMAELRAQIAKAAPSEGRILIFGENGTGKELVAREIHNLSNRREGPFVQLNCAAIPETLIESELFGHEKGSFTGAHRRKEGQIERAEGGTLLLDEIGDMAPETQAKLLRVLQEDEFCRVGSTTPSKFNVRILSATNKDLKAEIAGNRFREDLYFRLNVIPIRVPPLRERIDDIPVLADHFLRVYCVKNGKKTKTMSGDARARLQGYHWPGNIRELRNIMERLAIMTEDVEISLQDVETVFGSPASTAVVPVEDVSLKQQMGAFEKRLLHTVFQRCRGNVSRMAQVLGTDRANLHRKLKKYRIKD